MSLLCCLAVKTGHARPGTLLNFQIESITDIVKCNGFVNGGQVILQSDGNSDNLVWVNIIENSGIV